MTFEQAANSAADRLIVTADDFGLCESINEAVEKAHLGGILSAASLMVAAPAAVDAVRRAHALPNLGVGLHLVLVDGAALLPPTAIPDLVDAHGRFRDNMWRAGVGFFFVPRIRRQLAAEIRAQFDAFRATGLPLDHVNAHKHFHLHPSVLGLMLRIGSDYGLRAIRLPHEPLTAVWHAQRRRRWAKLLANLSLKPWVSLMRARLRRAGVTFNRAIYGLSASGAMDETRLLRLLRRRPRGVVEIYLHPATRSGREIDPAMAGYRHSAELNALMSAHVRRQLCQHGLVPERFSSVAAGRKNSTVR